MISVIACLCDCITKSNNLKVTNFRRSIKQNTSLLKILLVCANLIEKSLIYLIILYFYVRSDIRFVELIPIPSVIHFHSLTGDEFLMLCGREMRALS